MKIAKVHLNPDQPKSMFEQILATSEQLDALIGRLFQQKRYTVDDPKMLWEEYTTLSPQEQQNLYLSVLQYHNFLVSELEHESELTESSAFIEKSLKYLGLETSYALRSRIKSNSVVEIFDQNLRQFWRSLSFFRYSSYPVSVLYLRPFPKNFRREPESVNAGVFVAVKTLLEGNALIMNNVAEDHYVIEIDSPEKRVNYGSADQVAPVFQSGKISGLISIINVKHSNPMAV